MMDALDRSLAELRAELSPSSGDKARLRARILAPTLGGEAAAPPSRPLTRWAGLKAAGTLGLAAGALLLGVGAGAGFWLGREASTPAMNLPAASVASLLEPVPALRPPPEAEASPPLPALEPPGAASTPATSEPKRNDEPRPRATRKALPPNPLNDELALLRRVERALRNADPALALALLGELDERFPESRLVEERQAARLIADCRMDGPDADSQARAFLRDHPASVYRQRVQLACEIGTPPVAKHPAAAPMKEAVSPGH